jgi:Uma2 family endonuclease
MAAITGLTIDDFERLTSEEAENCELVEGELIPISSGTFEHNSTRDWFTMRVGPIIFDGRLGRLVAEQEYDFGGNVHAPDVSFFGISKLPLVNPKKRVQRFVPDLAIEIVSANDTVSALWRKKERYRACGTSEVWIVLPESREVSIYADSGDRILRGVAELSTVLIPGFRIAVDELFANL